MKIDPSEYAIVNGYSLIDNPDLKGYSILFGNVYWGYHIYPCENEIEILKELWNKSIHMSQSKRIGDVTLFYNCKLIRAVNNAQTPILRKKHNDPNRYDVWECSYNKYKFNDNSN